MITKIDRLFSRHRWVPVVIGAAIYLPLIVINITVGGPGIVYVLGVLTLLFSLLMGGAATIRLINRSVKPFNEQCDPYPMLEEANCQLGYVKDRSDRSLLTINRCVSLLEIGYFQQALEELEALNIDDPAVPVSYRHSYYHNLTVASIRCNQTEKAEVYYAKCMQQLNSAKGKVKEQLQKSHASLTAQLCLMRGEYQQAYDLLSTYTPENRVGQVHRAFALARIALAQGNPSMAKIHLEFVVQYGNRLYLAQQARIMLEQQSS